MSEVLGAAPTGDGAIIKDGTIETFEKDVLEASMKAPVIVDFWAEWCGPCKQLMPALEKAVTAAAGAVTLVKVDIDKNQMLASQLRIQSVPTVFAFFQGRPIDGFQGALPGSEIEAFIERVIAAGGGAGTGEPSTDDILAAADEAFEGGEIAAAAEAYSHVLQASSAEGPDKIDLRAVAGLAKCHLKADAVDQAQGLLELVPEEKRNDPLLSGIKAQLELAAGSADNDEVAALKAKVDAAPQDHATRFELAEALTANGNAEEGIEHLLAIFQADREWNEDAARKKILTIFEALGPTDPIVSKGRRRLSSLMFS